MKRILVYDWPTRFFHVVFAGLFIGAFSIAEFIDDDSKLYAYHMIMGIIMAFAVFLRIIWGFIGSRYALFSSFKLQPKELLNYFKDLTSDQSKKSIGHNPASSWASLTMMLLALGLGISGVLMSQDIYKDAVEEVHELLAKGFLLVVIAHISGVLFHSFKHKDAIGMSMIHGKKSFEDETQQISSPHLALGLLFVLLVGAFASRLNQNYDPNTGNLEIFGTILSLNDSDHQHRDSHKKHGSHDDDDDDDNDDDDD